MSKHAHHGGAWKVAYADFVTAMMALFLVLWLTAQDTRIKQAVERAFRNPFASLTKESMGIIPNDKDTDTLQSSKGSFDSASALEIEMLRKITEDLAKMLQQNPDEANNSVKLEMQSDGLHINVFDRSQKPIFEADTEKFTDYGAWVFSTLAWEISRYRTFKIELEGHTEVGHAIAKPEYSNWELSTDRANAARRRLLQSGVATTQIAKVAGYAETQPMADLDPQAEANRRVTVLLRVGKAPRDP
jgi:chemotaxis protein MotB